MCKSVLVAYICVCHVCAVSQTRAEDGVESLGTRVTVLSCHVGAGHQTPVFCKNSKCSLNLLAFSSSSSSIFIFVSGVSGDKYKASHKALHHSGIISPCSCLSSWLVYLDRFWCSPGWNLHSQKWPWTSDSCLYLSKCWDFRDVLPCLIGSWGSTQGFFHTWYSLYQIATLPAPQPFFNSGRTPALS